MWLVVWLGDVAGAALDLGNQKPFHDQTPRIITSGLYGIYRPQLTRPMAPANLPPVSSSASPGDNDLPAMFRPPVNRAMRVLDRSFFRKTVPISAAAIYKASDISNVRRVLLKNNDMLSLPRASSIREVRDQEDSSVVRKGILLREDIKHDGTAALVMDCDLEEAIAHYGLSRCCNVVV